MSGSNRGRPKQTAETRAAIRKEVKEKLWSPREVPLGLPDVWLPAPPSKKGTQAYSAWAKEAFLELLRHGYNYSQAAAYLGYDGYKWYANTKAKDPEWGEEAEKIRGGDYEEWEYPDLTGMPFSEFVEQYGGFTLAAHQIEMTAALEDPHGKLVMILAAPEHGKSTLVTLWYVLYRIAQNPDIRVALVSKSSDKANDLLRRIKRYLTEPHLYENSPRNLIEDFGGWQPVHGEMEWSNTRIFIRHRKSGERDPTVQALGIGKQIYGVRLDLLILDDSLVLDNQISEVQRQRLDNWFTAEARSRVQQGQTVICGTRLFPLDLYGQWRKALAGHPLYREVIVPAILDEWTDDERAAWPEYWTLDGYDITQTLENGEEVVTGYRPGLRDIRSEVMARNPDQWRLVYQQEDVQETSAIFRPDHVQSAFDLGAHRSRGTVFEHEQLILGVDPATTGRAAAVLLAYNPDTRVRTVIDMFVGRNLGAVGIRQKLLYHFWEKYRDHGMVTVIEINFAPTLLGDEALKARAESYNVTLRPFRTTARGRKKGSKWDDEYGIAAMASLFGSGLMAIASATPDDRAFFQPLIDDMLVFPFADEQDALIGLWVANSDVGAVPRKKVSQTAIQTKRGVPGVISNRMKKKPL